MHPDLAGLGRRPDLDAELRELGEGITGARVLAQHRGAWLIKPADAAAPRLVHARGRLRDHPEGRPVTGDWVALDEAGAIIAVLERHGSIVRRASGEPTRAQVLAANVELALVAEPAPEPNVRRIQRLAALASAGGVQAALLLTKADLDPDAVASAARIARAAGLADAVAVSMRDGDGLGVLRTLLIPDATAVLLGPSGAGKSTLVNVLLGEERQATQPVRAGDSRGRHTTVTRELLTLPSGALLIDTPGVRKAGLWDGTGSTFEDVESLARDCRFADCRHEDEPGCAVRDGLDPDQVAAWRKLQREQQWVDDRRAAERERRAWARDIALRQRRGTYRKHE